jgi:nitrogen-specific signal transduction histidine kinase
MNDRDSPGRFCQKEFLLMAPGATMPGPIIATRRRLHQPVLNLPLAFIEAMSGGAHFPACAKALTRAGVVTAEIAHPGLGVPLSLLDSILAPLVTTKVVGSGLGPSLCRTIASAHGGTLSIRNNLPTSRVTVAVDFPSLQPSDTRRSVRPEPEAASA